ncbi:MAG: hypothetical protein RLZZ540_445 [Bacteroidota bacterium]|jgi:hypothetical protein
MSPYTAGGGNNSFGQGSFSNGFGDGFNAGVGGTIGFFKSLGTAEGWQAVGDGFYTIGMAACWMCPEGSDTRTQMVTAPINYMQNVPNMSAYEIGYDLGFGTEKGLELVVTRGIYSGAGFGINTVKYGLGEAMWQSSTFGPKSLLFGRYHSQFLPFGRRGILNTGMKTGIGWSNHGARHVFRAKYVGRKFLQIYK